MRALFSRLAVLGVACAIAACSTVDVTTDYDHSVHFAKYKTYTYAPARDLMLAPVVEKALRDSIHTQLASRGITEVSGKKADLDVVPHLFLSHNVSTREYADWGHERWPYGDGYYGMWSGAPTIYSDTTVYTDGTLILDFVDAHTKKLVFRGTGTAAAKDPKANAAKVENAVAKIVAGIPSTH